MGGGERGGEGEERGGEERGREERGRRNGKGSGEGKRRRGEGGWGRAEGVLGHPGPGFSPCRLVVSTPTSQTQGFGGTVGPTPSPASPDTAQEAQRFGEAGLEARPPPTDPFQEGP